MRTLQILAVAASVFHYSTARLQKRAPDFVWGSTKIQGVNIGGWLVLEPFITPSIFDRISSTPGIVDEYTLGQKLPGSAPQILKQHWDSWVSLADFQRIASLGMNVVRIPIGYWAYDNSGSAFVQGAAPYMDKAIVWARQSRLKVIIDLHGAPGSQNGFDNSGERTDPTQIQFLKGGVAGATSQQTLNVLSMIAGKYAQASYSDVVVGIELLNEPFAQYLNANDLRDFTRQGFLRVRQISPSTTVVVQDGFNAPSSYNGFLTPSDGAENVAIDHHYYQVFSPGAVAMTPDQHVRQVCADIGTYTGADKWTFIGEWSAALTDCAKYLNGYGNGARYDGTFPGSTYVGSCVGKSSISSWDANYRGQTRAFIEAQIDAFSTNTQGWFYWNFKTETANEWSLFSLLDAGIFPNPLNSRQFPRAC